MSVIDSVAPVASPLKWWGGKKKLAERIIELMPSHLHYVEPYFGSGAVLFARDPFDSSKYWGDKSYEQGVSEVINDLNGELTNFWRVLQDEQAFAQFKRKVEAVPFSEKEWDDADLRQHPASPLDVDAAVAFFVRCRQSRTGGCKDFATLSRNRTRRGQNEQASALWSTVEGLPAVHARLKRVVIVGPKDALEVIKQQDGEKTLFYLDPPYLHETRTSPDAYEHEMSDDDHRRLLTTIKDCEGKVMLSGYPSDLYDRELSDWKRYDFETDNSVAGGKVKRTMTECVWCNF